MKKFTDYCRESDESENQGFTLMRKRKVFNKAVSSAIDDAETSFEEQNKKISRLELEIKALLNQTNALKTQINRLKNTEINHFEYICEKSAENESQFSQCMVEINPEYRDYVGKKNIIEINSESAALTECIKSENAEKAAEIFGENLRREMNNFHKNFNSRIIAVICTDLTMYCGMEAIRNEAYDIYNALRKKSCYNARLISIEKNITDIVCRGDIICIPAAKTRECLKKINPLLCVICESTAHVLTANDCGLLMFRSIVRLSGQNPLRDISENTLAELCHLNDAGIHKYCVQSEKAAKIMVENGFHEPEISYPVIDIEKHIYSCRKKNTVHKNFTVGFASSPMTEEQCSHRGMELLCKTVTETKGVQYLILWRNKDIEVPEVLKNSPDCRIEYGRYDMEKFYSEIDCVIIPYATENFNHACSVSAVEAMLNGIPVISTEIAGISEIVKKFGVGVVANQLQTACNQLRTADYNGFATNNLKDFFKQNNNIIRLIEHEASKEYVSGIVTLYEWNRLLKLKNKYLVKGHDSMINYYSNAEIASNYNAHRFEKYPQNCFDMMERKAVEMIISDYYSGRTDLEILDIACGDGRIVQENIKFGKCTAVDSSDAMIQLVANRCKPVCNQFATVKSDFFSYNSTNLFDAVTTFRYIRHFEYKTRKSVYKKIMDIMTKDGILIFDVPNRSFEIKLKNMNGWGNYNIYDVFFTKEDIIKELKNNGFEARYIIPTGKGLMERIPEPMTWTVGAVKKMAGA